MADRGTDGAPLVVCERNGSTLVVEGGNLGLVFPNDLFVSVVVTGTCVAVRTGLVRAATAEFGMTMSRGVGGSGLL